MQGLLTKGPKRKKKKKNMFTYVHSEQTRYKTWNRVVKPSTVTRVPTVVGPNVDGCKARNEKTKLAVSGSKVASALRVRGKGEGAASMRRSDVEGSKGVKAASKSAIRQWRRKT